jgi:hypothetical protein
MSSLTEDIQQTMRQLRRDLNRCKTCPSGEQCPVLQEYQNIINQAVASVLEEFSHL